MQADTTNDVAVDDDGLTEVDFLCFRPSGDDSVVAGWIDPNTHENGEWFGRTDCSAGATAKCFG